jgi:hypothetical protein
LKRLSKTIIHTKNGGDKAFIYTTGQCKKKILNVPAAETVSLKKRAAFQERLFF